MKKLVYIFSLLLLACACNLQDFEPQTSRDADKVRLSLSLSVPEAQSLTRAMDDKPQLQTLHLVVFDQNGMLVEYAQAQNLVKATENGTLYKFNVALTISDTPRHIHFVGNSPVAPKFGMETDVMTAMETKSGADAYWYRKTIAKIEATTDTKGNLIPTDATKAAFGVIPLVRNFAKIVVTSSAKDFVLDSYAIAGRPEKGKVAPYNRTKGAFQDFVKSDGTMKTYEELTGEDYDAFSPTGVGLDFSLADSDFNPNEKAKYVYERETPLSNASYVIVKGKYKGGSNFVYYKVNLRDKDGNYVPLRRNFQYNINISEVTRNGYATVADAVASSGSGDISTDLEFISLTNISDGEVRLSVEYTSKTLVTDDPVTLQVKFEKVGNSATLGDVEFKIGAKGETGAAILNAEKTAGPESGGGSYTYKVTPVAVSATQKTQSLIITGNYTLDGKSLSISREVSYTLMEKRVMSAKCIPSEVPEGQGQAFDLQITIPDGLGESMFPLEFSIEAVKLSITPKNDDMPVESGKSTIPGSTKKSSFWFVKTLSYEEYKAIALNEDQTKSFLCHFATNMANSATAIYVSNPYFNQTSCKLGNYVPQSFQNLKYDDGKTVYPEEDGTPVTFTFTTTAILSQGNITVTLTGLLPADDENQLAYAGVDANGNPMYTLAANATSYTLKLIAADAETDFNVKLDAYHFVTAEASATRSRIMYDFVNPTFPDRVNWKTNKTAKFTFSYYSADVIESVTMTLTNIKPQDGDTRFKLNTDETYTFTPAEGSGVYQEINFVTTSDHGSVGVTMESKHHNSATASRKRYYNFTANLTLVNGPGGWNPSKITSSNGQTIDRDNPKITVDGEYDASYSITFSYDRGFYRASATIQDLSDGNETITFDSIIW